MDGNGRAVDAFDAGSDRILRSRHDVHRRGGWKFDPTWAGADTLPYPLRSDVNMEAPASVQRHDRIQ